MNLVRSKIRRLVQEIIDNRTDFVEGCRQIADLSHSLNNSERNTIEEHILFIKGVFSESDRFPVGEVRKTCSPEHLEELDLDKKNFIAFYRPQVLDACQNIMRLT